MDYSFFFSQSEPNVKHNARIKYYFNPDTGEYYPVETLIASQPVFKESGWELSDDKKHTISFQSRSKNEFTANEFAIMRARRKLYDLIRCNGFKWFVTLTYNDELGDRTDYAYVSKRFSQWMSNRVKRNGLKYVGVIEKHKKSEGLHFHVLCSDSLNLIDSGTVKCEGRKRPIKVETANKYKIPLEQRKTVYNVTDWKYGFSTAIEVTQDPKAAKVAGYLRKYLTKDSEKIGGRYYYSGGHLERPKYLLSDVDYSAIFAAHYEFSVGGTAYKGLKME